MAALDGRSPGALPGGPLSPTAVDFLPNNGTLPLLALDESGDRSRLPWLPVLMADGGATGMTTMPVLQSLSPGSRQVGRQTARLA